MSSGSSGGPIVNASGEVVGVSVMVQTTGGNGVGSLNYGVASDQVGSKSKILALCYAANHC